MAYPELEYVRERARLEAIKRIELKQQKIEQSCRLMPDAKTNTAKGNITYDKKHINSMAEALRKVNPRKWK